jgi:hypothetical protein
MKAITFRRGSTHGLKGMKSESARRDRHIPEAATQSQNSNERRMLPGPCSGPGATTRVDGAAEGDSCETSSVTPSALATLSALLLLEATAPSGPIPAEPVPSEVSRLCEPL